MRKFFRGQSFETMMLVISVIVALAILAALLNVIKIFQPPGSEIDKVVTDEFSSVVAKGYGCSQPQRGIVKRGAVIFGKQVIGSVVGWLDSDKVSFTTDASKIGTATSGALSSRPKLTVNTLATNDAQVFVTVCVDVTGTVKTAAVCMDLKQDSTILTNCAP